MLRSMHVLELSNREMGAFRARLLRRGERYGLHHMLIYNDDRPVVEFYGPFVDGEPIADAPFLGRFDAGEFACTSDDWLSLGWGGYLGISPENQRELAAWLEKE